MYFLLKTMSLRFCTTLQIMYTLQNTTYPDHLIDICLQMIESLIDVCLHMIESFGICMTSHLTWLMTFRGTTVSTLFRRIPTGYGWFTVLSVSDMVASISDTVASEHFADFVFQLTKIAEKKN